MIREVGFLSLSIAVLAGCATRTVPPREPEVQVGGAGLDPSETTDPKSAGRQRLADGDYRGALALLRLAEEREPEQRDDLRVDQALALHHLAMDESALALLDRVVLDAAGLPAGRRALALSGAIHAGRDELVEAEDRLTRSLTGDDSWPGAARALSDLGVVLLRRGEVRRGRDALLRARELFYARGDTVGARICEQNLAASAALIGNDGP